MKNIKNYAMALVALVIAATSITLMSFSEKGNEKIFSQWYFQPVGSSTDQDDPNNYVPFNPTVHTDCGGESENLCSIIAPENESTNKPQLDPNVPVTINELQYSPTRRME